MATWSSATPRHTTTAIQSTVVPWPIAVWLVTPLVNADRCELARTRIAAANPLVARVARVSSRRGTSTRNTAMPTPSAITPPLEIVRYTHSGASGRTAAASARPAIVRPPTATASRSGKPIAEKSASAFQ